MARLVPAASVALAILAALACSTPVPTGYLQHQPQLAKGKFLDGVWCSERVGNSAPYSQVTVGSIEPRGITDQKGVSAADAASWLRAELLPSGGDVLLPLRDAGTPATLEIAITEMTPGSVAARFWAGELGAGHAYVQVEGRLVDPADASVLCEFVQRTNASGIGGLRDLAGDAGPKMVREMLGMVARAIRSELMTKFGTPAT